MLEEPAFALAHYNNLFLNDRVVFDNGGTAPVGDNEEGDRLAALMGDKTIMVMGAHGVSVVGPTVADAFDECYMAERTCMYQMTAMATGRTLRTLPASGLKRYNGPWGEKIDARMHLDAWRRILDRDEADYAS